MMRRNLYFLNQLRHLSAHEQSIAGQFEQHPARVAETSEPPVGVLAVVL
jgi:hypothetical protein